MENKNNQRIRKVRKWGDQLVIPVNVFDQRDLEIEAGDEVDISDIVVKKTKKQRGEKK